MTTNGRTATDQSLGQLVSKVTTNVSSLVRLEIELAKAELSAQARQGAAGGGMLVAAAGRGGLALLVLSFAAVYGLAQVMPVWAAFLVVAGVYLLVAVLLGLLAVRQFKAVKGPERAIAQAEQTRDLLAQREGLRDRSHSIGLSAAELAELRDEAAANHHAYETPPPQVG